MKLESFKEKNAKKKGIILFTICCVLLIAGVFFYSSFALFETKEVFNLVSGNVKEMQDISFTYYVDHQIVKEAPTKTSGKVFDQELSSCTNEASVRWNYEDWSPVVTNWNQTKTKCSISFSTAYSEDILNGSFPSLKNGLIPITIKNDGLVKKADTTSKWYSYEEKNWANAVITRSSFDGLQYNGKVSGATKQDGYVSFDGVDDYVDLGLENYDFGSSATIAVKFRLTKTSTDWQNLLDNIAKAGFCLSVSTDQLLTFSIYSSDVSGYVTVQSEPIDLQKEYVAVGVYENQQMKLYLNGVLIGEKSLSNAATVSGMPFVLGANPDASGYSQYASTDIFQATILDRALTEEEVKENYASDIKVKNEEGLLKYVNFAKDMYEANEVIPEESIESYFVWIPRYRYKIFNEGNYNGLTANIIDNKVESKSQEIEIKFENKDVAPSTGVSVGEWLTHPAFTSFHSNGMWIGKFETSKSNTNPDNSVNPEGVQIKPNVSSWRYVQVANAFYSAYDYKRNLDSHMMKNTEWGAVAYFSHTIY